MQCLVGHPLEDNMPQKLIGNNDDDTMMKYWNFEKFDTAYDYSESKPSSQPTTQWSKRIQDEWRILRNGLPDLLYESRIDLLRAVIKGSRRNFLPCPIFPSISNLRSSPLQQWVNTNAPSSNTLTQSNKLLAIPPITSLIPVKLDLEKSNYSSWCFFFKTHSKGLQVLDHIQAKSTSSSADAITPPTIEWLKVTSLLMPISQKLNPLLPYYPISDLPCINDDLVTHAIDGLSDRYAHVASIIAHKDPFPDLDTVRSMVTTEELRLKHKVSSSTLPTTPSAPTVLLAESSRHDSRDYKALYSRAPTSPNACRHYGRTCQCKWGPRLNAP
ncbi:ubiquitin conjugating enzyme [Artemisia annua]|uniref:Ubiquitin conjugating enzyme n=1 Tax=Artemisia annua TaxID=35608 RepID=A0A2U1NII8_ARTAN|nr:ubiquitin conjugating enzyme [Artemisia annua]